jgi:hypothetical protein
MYVPFLLGKSVLPLEWYGNTMSFKHLGGHLTGNAM